MMASGILQRIVKKEASSTFLTYTFLRSLKTQTVTCSVTRKGGVITAKKKQLNVETDPQKLCTRLCGGNIYKEGEDPVLGKDDEYPNWLWNLRLEKTPIPLEELSEDDPRYWRRLKRISIKQQNSMRYLNKL